MAKIKKLKENGSTIYPATILEAVLDSKTSTPLSKTRLRYTRASAHGQYYKFMSLARGPEKGILQFGVISPLMGYAEYMIQWSYQTQESKDMSPYCLFSTNSEMYNRVKLVRTGNDTFDAYFESNAGNDYPAFVFMGEGGTANSGSITSYTVFIVSSIPTVYATSTYRQAYFGTVSSNTFVGNLTGIADSSKALIARTETDINADVFKTPGVYSAPISTIDVNTIGFAESVELKGTSIIMTVGQDGTNIRYQYIFVQEDTGSYLYSRMLDPISAEQEAFKYFMPEIPTATSDKAGTVKSGGNITVGSDGTVTVNKALAADVAEEASHASNADVATLASTASIADNATTADGLNTASNVAGDEDMPDTDSVQSFAGYVGKDKTNKCPILSVTTEFLDGSQQLSLQIGYSTEHGLMCRIGGRETNGEFTFSDWQKILTQDI